MQSEVTEMEENLSMKDFETQISASMRKVSEGDVLTGTVIGLTEKEVILDLSLYTGGVIRAEDMSEDPHFSIKSDVKIGDEITATVIKTDDGEGNLLLSRKTAHAASVWEHLKEMQQAGQVYTAKVSEVVNGGVVVYIEGTRGFVPASKLALSYVENLSEYAGKEIRVQIITVDAANRKLVLSAKELLKVEAEAEHKKKVSNVTVGLVTEGIVESIKPYGAFVTFGDGLSGLLHISQICEKRIRKPEEVIHVGDKVNVKIIAIKDGQISLSMKEVTRQDELEHVDEEIELPESESCTTSLGDLFKRLGL